MTPLPPPLPAGPAPDRARAALGRAEASPDGVWISRPGDADVLAAAEGAPPGPLHGVVVGVKDNIDVGGMRTTAACPAYAYIAPEDAPAVARLTATGAVVLGKTNMDQFATGLVGTRSPYGVPSAVGAPGVISGGSSSGSAVAVASGQVDVALGTDTAGSGRVPAALNGIVGLKPTRGLVPTDGVVPACRSLDCVSVFARTVAEARLVLGVMADGPGRTAALDARRALTAPARPVVGVPAAGSLQLHGDEEGGALFAAAVAGLRDMGAEIVEVDLAPFLAAARLLYEGPWIAERLAAFGEFVLAHPDEVNPVVREVVERSVAPTAADAYRGMYALEGFVAETAPIWEAIDALAIPTHVTAPTHADVAADPHGVQAKLGTYTNFVNLMDLCAISLPAGRRSCGAGFGLQLVAPAFGDALLCDLGARFEAASAARGDAVRLAVVGAHLTGQPLNHQLTSRGARLVETTRTAGEYRLYALAGTIPPKPGLVRTGEADGAEIEVEVWELGAAAFGAFTAEVPPPLGIGTVTLAGGGAVKGFICEPAGLEGAADITGHGGWRAYLRELAEAAR